MCARSFRGADCNTTRYLVFAKVWEELSVSKKSAEFDMERFNLKKLKDMEVKEQFHVKISDRYAAMEISYDNANISKAWEIIRT
jgi:hypothetical protein